uniref:Uncharacterized protein n=1 Tax=Megaselia scalaris TaxID=36166 RepID=T1GX06_MEGSC
MQSVESNIKDEEINKLRKFWIDQIEIDNESSYKMFLMQNPGTKRIYMKSPLPDANGPKNYHIHFGVTCDNCDQDPIIGF